MSLRNRLVLPILLSGLAALAGCGSSNSVVPPPSGAFSNTDFTGTYTFSVVGSDPNGASGSSPMSIAGSFTACGCTGGTISGGTADFDDDSLVAPGSAIGANSTYNILKDGRGTANLFITPTAAGSAAFLVTVDFVLTSSSHGLIIRYDSGGTGSGTIDQQPNAVSQGAIENTPYAFSLSGAFEDNPLAQVGAFTLDSSGQIVDTAVTDLNLGIVGSTGIVPQIFSNSGLSGSLSVGSGPTTPGTASLTSSFGTNILFDVYAVDATHLKLIESDGIASLVGDVFTQSSSASIPAGNLVYTMQGVDPSEAEFTAGGLMAVSGNQITSGSEDYNDAGQVDGGVTPPTPFSFGGNFSTVGNGRFVIGLTGFIGGTTFAAYPSSGGILMMEIDSGANVGQNNSGITTGIALPQTSGAALAAAQGYGLNNSGQDTNTGAELDEIGQFTTTSTGMTGNLNDNDSLSLGSPSINGSYTAGTNGAGSATLSNGLQSIFYYAADSSTVLFISTDPNQAAAGVIEAQSAPSGSADETSTARPRALPMFRALPRLRKGMPHSQGKIGLAK
jgi:hypothetical protein